MSFSALLGRSLRRRLVIILPAEENTLSDETSVAGIGRYFLTIGISFENLTELSAHHLNGSSKIVMQGSEKYVSS